MALVSVLAAAGCDAQPDDGPAADAPPAQLAVEVLAPNGGEALVAAEPVEVRWTSTGGTSFDVALVDGAGVATELVSGVSGTTAAWTPVGVPAPTPYRIRVTASDGARSVADDSDAEFTVSPPSQGVSLAATLQPLFSARCTNQFCHDATTGASGLVLVPGRSFSALVGVTSRHAACQSYQLVAPGQPSKSFLVFKLDGTGACFAGVRMPKNASPLSAAQIQLVRQWITEGAKNN